MIKISRAEATIALKIDCVKIIATFEYCNICNDVVNQSFLCTLRCTAF